MTCPFCVFIFKSSYGGLQLLIFGLRFVDKFVVRIRWADNLFPWQKTQKKNLIRMRQSKGSRKGLIDHFGRLKLARD